MAEKLRSLSFKPQRQLLVRLLRHNPQKDTPTPDPQPEADQKDVELLIEFQEFHLPELEDHGFVEYNRDQNLVTKGPHFGEIQPLVELIADHRDELPADWR